jgi:hypothetical protein
MDVLFNVLFLDRALRSWRLNTFFRCGYQEKAPTVYREGLIY